MATTLTRLKTAQASDLVVLQCIYEISPSGQCVDEGDVIRRLIAEHGMPHGGAVMALVTAQMHGFIALPHVDVA